MKQIAIKGSIAIALMALFVGCGEEKPKFQPKTSEYYDNHLEEAKARVAECKKLEVYDEAEQMDCRNAQRAAISNKANRTNPFEATKDAPMPKFR